MCVTKQTIKDTMAKYILLSALCFSALMARAQDVNIKKLKSLSMEELMDIEVTSVSKRKEKIIETASAIQVITSDDIRQSGATTVAEALRLAPNLQVAQVNSSQWAISARGFNNVLANKLLVLIDGRVVYTPMYAGVFWDVQNLVLEDIDRIEVISGPGGTLWGANAVNGVINIITKSTRDTKGIYAEAVAGTEVRSLGSIRYGGKLSDKLYYRVYGTAFRRGNTMFQDSIEARDDWQMAQGGLRMDWNASEKDQVMVQFNHYDGRPDPDSDQPVKATGTNALARWQHTISDNSNLQVQVYYDKTWRDFRNGFADKLSTYDIEAQHRFKPSQVHEFIYGIGFRMMDHDVTNLELFAFKPANKKLYLFNAFVQDDIALIQEKLKLTLGIKIEHNTYTDYQYQPNVRLTWMPKASQTIWTAVSRAVRNPARIDREFYLDLAPNFPFIIGGDFQSEEVLAYELGWHTRAWKNLSFSIASFYNVYDNIRSVKPGPPPLGIPVTFANDVKGNTYGAELTFMYQIAEWWRLRGGYTYLKKDLSVKTGSVDENEGTAESNDPTHQALLQSTMQVLERGSIGTIFRYIGELPQPYVSDYIALDIRLSWNLTKMIEISVVGQNILQSHHTEFIPSSPETKDIERGIYGKVIWKH